MAAAAEQPEKFVGDEYERLLSDDEDDVRSAAAAADTGERQRADVCKRPSSGPPRHEPVDAGQRAAYGLGHVFNDITAAIWFSYTMVFMQDVVGMPPTMAGLLLFFG